jgi:glycosyltransferase involved in cell wall biosynthesis
MKVGYFINAYPKVSHTFIRREIHALEEQGVEVARYALRAGIGELVDERDRREFYRTRVMLGGSRIALAGQALAEMLRNLPGTLRAAFLAAKVGYGSERGLLRHFAYVLEAAILGGWCRQDGVKHLHAHFGTNSATVAMLVMAFSGITFSFTAHGADELDGAGRKDMRAKLEAASFIVAVSSYLRSQLLRRLPHRVWDKVKVVHCGLDDDFLKAPLTPVSEKPVFVCVGRLCDEKAQTLLMEAARILRDRGLEFRIVLAGDGPSRGQIEDLISRYGLESKIRITGWVSSDQIQEELNKARFFVLPSLIEGLPVAIMEAMALGRPVISTYISGIPELVVNDQTGWLVPSGDAVALADAMERALQTPGAKIAEMSEAARQRVRERHDVKREAGKLAELFRPLVVP